MAVTVVLVDDHAGFRSLARRMLADDGFDVVAEAAGGAEAVTLVEDLRPDLVLLDVRLPDLDGFAVAQQLRARGIRARIVLVSTRQARDYGDRPARCGADAFLSKSALTGPALRTAAGMP